MTIAVDSIENYSEIQAIIRSILITNAQNGATIEEIRNQYYEMTGENLPFIDNMTEFLLEIKGIMCFVDLNGTRIFHLFASEKSQHILSMVQNQKPSKNHHYHNHRNKDHNENITDIHTSETQNTTTSIIKGNQPSSQLQSYPNQPRARHSSINETDTSNSETNICIPNNICFFKNNYQYYQKHQNQNCVEKMNNSWNSRQTITSTGFSNNNNSNNNNYDQEFYENFFKANGIAHLYDFQLMGDDFFLSMAKMELGCKIKKDNKGSRSGLCISGLTIRRAIKLIENLQFLCPNIIINIGSVDILNGRDLVDIEYDFRCLKKVFLNRGIKPIFTTLAPLGNFGHKSERYIIERFNDFIRKNNDIYVIDLWPCMVNQKGHTLYECYQNSARYVTGSDQPHVLWNKLGRQRVLKKIKSEIELLPV